MPNYTYIKKVHKVQNHSKNFRYALGIALLLLLTTIVIQLLVMSHFAIKGDEVAVLEAERQKLILENKLINEKIAEVRNIEYVKASVRGMGFVEINPDEVNYLKLEEK